MKVRAIKTCFVDNGFRSEGTEFDYSGPHNTNLEYLDTQGVEAEAMPVPKKWGQKARLAAELVVARTAA